MIENRSTKELLEELEKREGVKVLPCGQYQPFKLVGKYRQKLELPSQYQVILVTPN